jgi:hypothetical protein
MGYKGDVLIVLGVLLIVVAFFMGYGLYNSASNYSLLQSSNKISGNNITNSFNSLANDISTVLTGPTYEVIQIIILFLFASIGYKIADLGIRLNSITLDFTTTVEEKQKNKK